MIGACFRGPRDRRIGTGGLHGIGFPAVNALSEWLHAESANGSSVWRSEYLRGAVSQPPIQCHGDWTGMRVRFLPDAEIFSSIEFSPETIRARLIDLAGLWRGLRFDFCDLRTNTVERIEFSDGVRSLVRLMNELSTPCCDQIPFIHHESQDFRLDVAIQHTNKPQSNVQSFVNAVRTPDGGSHCTGFNSGFTRAVNQSLKDSSIERVAQERELAKGLTAVVSIWVDDPSFEGPTKTRFKNSAIQGTVESAVYRGFLDYFTHHPDVLDAISARTQCLRQ